MLTKYFCKIGNHSYVEPKILEHATDEELGKCEHCDHLDTIRDKSMVDSNKSVLDITT